MEVSNLGKVFKNGRPLNIYSNHDGYSVVALRCSSGWRSVGVHRLVATAFIPKENEGDLEVNHIDFNRQNNCFSNLEWVSHLENVSHSRKAGRYKSLYGENNPNYGNHTLSKKYRDNPELSREKQSRPGAQNGRARVTDLYYEGEFLKSFPYYKKCCEYLADELGLASTSYISGRLDECAKSNRSYRGYSVVKH